MRTTYSVVELSADDSFLGIDLAMSHSLEGRVGDTAPDCRLRARLAPFTTAIIRLTVLNNIIIKSKQNVYVQKTHEKFISTFLNS